MLNKSIVGIISCEYELSGTSETNSMRVQKNDETLREKVGSALALRLARLGGGHGRAPRSSSA